LPSTTRSFGQRLRQWGRHGQWRWHGPRHDV